MAVSNSNGIRSSNGTALRNSGSIHRGGVSSIPKAKVAPGLGQRGGSSGAINRGSSSIPNAKIASGRGERGGSSGAINRGSSSIPNAGRVTGLGERSGESGAINRGSSSIPNAGRGGGLGERSGSSGAINRGSSAIPNAGRGGGLGERSGSSGAINRGESSILKGARVGSKGLRVGSLRIGGVQGAKGLRGSSLQSGSGLRKGQSGTGKKLSAGAKKTQRPPSDKTVLCGDPISGSFHLEILWSFDEFGRVLPPVVRTCRAILCGKEWTPENPLDYATLTPSSFYPRYPAGEQSETRHVIGRKTDDLGWPGAGFVALNTPAPNGRVLRRVRRTMAMSGGSSTTARFVAPPEAGRSIYIENACFLP